MMPDFGDLKSISARTACRHWTEIPAEFGSLPECAFDVDGAFNPDNWNCHLMNQLREDAIESAVWAEDDHLAVLAYPGQTKFAVLYYYKSRGRTLGFWIFETERFRQGTQTDAEEYVKLRKSNDH